MTTSAEHAHRIEITQPDAHVRISRDGVELADTHRAVVLREGKLPPRYYIPADDVRTQALEATDTHTHCPFKGDASYWSVRIGDEVLTDFVWSYPHPIPGAEKIAGLLCFYNEEVDIELDGKPLERPATRWS